MINPPEGWTRLENPKSKLDYMKKWKLAPATATYAKALTYVGGYSDKAVPCYVRGYDREFTVVVEIEGYLHCVNIEHLLEMQSGYAAAAVPEVFVVVDLETTGFNPKIDQIIEIGAAKYIEGKEAGSFEALINPRCSLSKGVTSLTGITEFDLLDSPCIEDVLPAFVEFLGAATIVAHNAPFDISFLAEAYGRIGLELTNAAIDTVKIARSAFPEFEKHSLEYLKEKLNIFVDCSHRAMPDVRATAELYSHCIARLREIRDEKNTSVSAVKPTRATSTQKQPESLQTPIYFNIKIKISEIKAKEEIDPEHPLYGKRMVFTGELSIGRTEAMQMAADSGAVLTSSVSKKTDYLVVGRQDTTLVGEDGMSTKEEKAQQLNEKGHTAIRVLNESEFLSLVNERVLPEELEDAANRQPKELEFYNYIRHDLESVVLSNNAEISSLEFTKQQGYYSFKYKGNVVFMIHYGAKFNWWLQIPPRYKTMLDNHNTPDMRINPVKLKLASPPNAFDLKNMLCEILEQIIDNTPKSFSCCSRYVECSDAKTCVQPDSELARECSYRINLKRGKIFYGKNSILKN